jgi:EpsI family protein
LQWLAAGVAVLVLSVPPGLAAYLQAATVKSPALTLPDLAGVPAEDGASPLHKPVFEGARAEAARVYGQGSSAVTVHVAFYRQQTYGRKLVNSQNMLVTSEDKVWRRTERGTVTLPIAGRPVDVRTAELRSGGVGGSRDAMRLQVRQVYWVNGRLTASDHLAALLGVAGQIAGQGDDAAAITFYMAGDDAVATSQALDAFVSSHLPALGAWLDVVRADR